jgi:hypothetical protein
MLRAALLAAAMTALALPAHAQTCTRDNLKTFVANYFKAVETHNLSALPTAPNLRITENGVETKAGEGFVKTGGKATILRSLIDTERCGTLTQALVDETVNGTTQPVIFAVRLKVTSGKVSEIETLMARKGGTAAGGFNFYDPEALLATKGQDWETPLPKDKRPTRAYMNEQANKYFSGFAVDPKDLPNFATPCHRWEGGVQTTKNNGNCSPKGLAATHTHRRFPVTDTEAGITAGFISFNQGLPDVHMFKFNQDGQVIWIQAVFGGRVDANTQIWPDEK